MLHDPWKNCTFSLNALIPNEILKIKQFNFQFNKFYISPSFLWSQHNQYTVALITLFTRTFLHDFK